MKHLHKMPLRLLSVLITVMMLVSLVPMSVFAADSNPTIEVSTVKAQPGKTVDVTVSLKDNPGVASVNIDVAFNSTVLTLQSVVYGDVFEDGAYEPENLNNPVALSWSNLADITGDCTFATLTFLVSETAAADNTAEIKVSYEEGYISNIAEQLVEFEIENGGINVVAGVPGDINNDLVCDARDLIRLRKYFAKWDVETDPVALDVNGDNEINSKDLLRLRKYFAKWDVEIWYGTISYRRCIHNLELCSFKAATCENDGNKSYYRCTKCGKYYEDFSALTEITLESTVVAALGHHMVTDEAVAPTYTSTGLTEGSHCDRLGCDYCISQEVIPMLKRNEWSITYEIAGNDSYLKSIEITNPNENSYEEGVGLDLKELVVDGYNFEGWYDGQGSAANRVTQIGATEAKHITLFAKWKLADPYTVVFKYDKELAGLIDTSKLEGFTYTVNKTTVLPVLSLPGYTFIGWSDENGVLCDQIEPGTTGEKQYYANWVSNRNKAWKLKDLGDPYVYEDDDIILFTYEIGKIENVPLYEIENFGYINSNGISESRTKEISAQMSESMVSAYSSAVEKATTGNATWTLSDGWTDSVNISEEWAEENGTTAKEEQEKHLSETGNWYVNTTTGGSHTSTTVDSTDEYDLKTTTNNTKTYGSTDTTEYDSSLNEDGWNIDGTLELGATETLKTSGVIKKLGADGGVELSQKLTVSGGKEGKTTDHKGTDTVKKTGEDKDNGDGTQTGTVTNHSTSTVDVSNWNNESGFGGSTTNETSEKIALAVSQTISNKTGIGKSYIITGESSETQGLSTTNANKDSFSSQVTYSKLTQETETVTYSTGAAVTGYHRWVMAGIADVFGVVGYDKENESYFVTTYTVMDDTMYKYQDYSYKTGAYDDNQSGIIDFCIPDDVKEYVEARTFTTEGLEFNLEGYVTAYKGTDSAVVIPEYVAIDNLDGKNTLVKIVGIEENVFKGNTNITGVALSDFITEIPAHAFEGCTELWDFAATGVNKIGEYAFAGCTKLHNFTITSDIISLGNNAFTGVGFLEVEANRAVVVEAALKSGAESIVIDLQSITDSLDGKMLTIPEEVEEFVIRGYGATYQNLTVVSNAKSTKINRLNIDYTLHNTNDSGRQIPLELNSQNIALCQCTINSDGIGVLLNDPDAKLELYGTLNLASNCGYSLLCRDVAISRIEGQLLTELNATGNVVTCGTIEGQDYLKVTDGEVTTVTEEEFEKLLNPYKLVFDAGDGSCDVEFIEVPNGTLISDLPLPTREYFDFDGWYTEEEEGTQIEAGSVLVTATDITLYAHWTKKTYDLTFDTRGGCLDEIKRKAYCGDAIGELPTPTREYYDFDGWFTEADGGEAVTAESVFSADTTIYAHWTAVAYNLYFDANQGECTETSRKPLCEVAIGELPTPTRTGYSFDGWFTAADGGEQVTAETKYYTAEDVTIYAHWTALAYSVNWNTGTGYSISVSRTESPCAGAATGALDSGATVYFGDVLSISYGAWEGYTLAQNGATTITVSDNVTGDSIWASVSANSYTYDVVYYSSNGTYLGGTTVSGTWGSSQTISAPYYAGYNTPGSQTITWDATSKTVTFYYSIVGQSTSQSAASDWWWQSGSGGITYAATVEYQNRTSSSVQVRVIWVQSIKAAAYGYNQYFNSSIGGVSTGDIQIATTSTWPFYSSSGPWHTNSVTVNSGWITVPVSATATSVYISTSWWDQRGSSGSWGYTMAIPTY